MLLTTYYVQLRLRIRYLRAYYVVSPTVFDYISINQWWCHRKDRAIFNYKTLSLAASPQIMYDLTYPMIITALTITKPVLNNQVTDAQF
jgi:hypothetical protein